MVVFLVVVDCWGDSTTATSTTVGSGLPDRPQSSCSPNRGRHHRTTTAAGSRMCCWCSTGPVLVLLLLLISAAAAATTPTPAWTRSEEDPSSPADAEESWLDEMEYMCRTQDLRAGNLEAQQQPSKEPSHHYQQHHQYLPDHLAAVTEFSTNGGGILWHDLSVSSGTANILQPFSFHIGNGQLVGLLGPSGSGK